MGKTTPELFADLKSKAVARAVKHLHAAVQDRKTSPAERVEPAGQGLVYAGCGQR